MQIPCAQSYNSGKIREEISHKKELYSSQNEKQELLIPDFVLAGELKKQVSF